MINPFRLLKMERKADALVTVLDEGAAHPNEYQTETFWGRVVRAAVALVSVLPLPKGVDMSQFWHKFAMISGLILTVGSQVQGMQLPLPANVQGILGLVVALAAAIQHNPIGSTPAGSQAIGAK